MLDRIGEQLNHLDSKVQIMNPTLLQEIPAETKFTSSTPRPSRSC